MEVRAFNPSESREGCENTVSTFLKQLELDDVLSAVLVMLLGFLAISAYLVCALGIHHYIVPDTAPKIHAEELYEANWGFHINEDCSEIFFVESGYNARGEGWRFHVLLPAPSGASVGITEQEHNSDIEETHGFGTDSGVDRILSELYRELEVPKEYQCSSSESRWRQYQQKDGSNLVILVTGNNQLYIAEKLV